MFKNFQNFQKFLSKNALFIALGAIVFIFSDK